MSRKKFAACALLPKQQSHTQVSRIDRLYPRIRCELFVQNLFLLLPLLARPAAGDGDVRKFQRSSVFLKGEPSSTSPRTVQVWPIFSAHRLQQFIAS